MAGFSILQEAAIPFNGSGAFSLAEPAFVPNTTISSAAVNSDLSDIANGLSDCLTTDGQSQMSAALKAFAGTVTQPGFTFATDPNTGIYRISGDNIGVACGGNKILDISTTGLTVTGNSTYSGNETVTGNATIGGTLAVTGASTFTGIVTDSSTSHSVPASGTTAQRPSVPAESYFRYNTTTHAIEFYDGFTWIAPALANPPTALFKSLAIKVASDTTVTVQADFVVTSDGSSFKSTPVNSTINFATVGANGIDAGSIAAATWYAIWVIAKPDGTTSALASTSGSSPAMPSGYTYKSRMGWVVTHSSFATLLVTWQIGTSARYIATGVGLISLPTFSSTSYTAISITNYVPSTAYIIDVTAMANGGAAIMIAPNNQYSTSPISTTGRAPIVGVATGNGACNGSIFLESTNIYAAAETGGTGKIFVVGWEDNL